MRRDDPGYGARPTQTSWRRSGCTRAGILRNVTTDPIWGFVIDDLYSKRVLSLAATMPRTGRLQIPDGTGEQVAKLCGSRAVVDVRLDADGRISEFAQDVRACALGQAAASIVGEVALGARLQDLEDARLAMVEMLKRGGEGPAGRFEGLRILRQVADYPARHASSLVALDATISAVRDALCSSADAPATDRATVASSGA